ncbi:MAG: hypothetical protein E6G50_06240 [Actinobacteria bacterium]|nr:MAG: hypothetical protein E6G50_06240 [Actinomycetota bacterium]
MYGLTRATTTLIAAAVAGLLIWFATQINDHSRGGFWAVYGLIAGAGLVMALSQLLGGWTKWGSPRLSAPFLLIAFVPIAVASLWIVLAAEPGTAWVHRHVLAWSGDLHIRGLVNDLKEYVAVLAFGIGLVFGFSFDTTGPRRRVAPAAGRGAAVDRRASDEPVTAEREEVGTAPRGRSLRGRNRESVGATRTPDDA